MKTALAIRHLHFEDLGTLAPQLNARGYAVQYIDATVDDLAAIDADSPDLLAVLGGPIGAYDDALHPFLRDEVALVSRRLHSQRPLLGVCLGAQLMARALGAQVYAMGVKEIGFSPLELTAEGHASPLAALAGVPVLHWHGDQFNIPLDATHLAGTATCPHQAYAVGTHALGLQFHAEVDSRLIERWLVGHACELGHAGIDPCMLRDQAARVGAQLATAAQAMFGAWLDGLTASAHAELA